MQIWCSRGVPKAAVVAVDRPYAGRHPRAYRHVRRVRAGSGRRLIFVPSTKAGAVSSLRRRAGPAPEPSRRGTRRRARGRVRRAAEGLLRWPLNPTQQDRARDMPPKLTGRSCFQRCSQLDSCDKLSHMTKSVGFIKLRRICPGCSTKSPRVRNRDYEPPWLRD